MPTGRYIVLGEDGAPIGEESFRCAPGPAGWRYVSDIRLDVPEPHVERVDLAVDSGWRPVRLRVATGSHELVLRFTGEHAAGLLDGEPLDLPWGTHVELDYASPAFNGVTANRLGRTAEFDVLFLDPVTCLPHLERQRYEPIGEEDVTTPVGVFTARRWLFTSLSGSGFTAPFWVAGDVVVAYEGVFELAGYEPGAGPVPRPA